MDSGRSERGDPLCGSSGSFGVSRTHVRNLMQDAERPGWSGPPAGGRSISSCHVSGPAMIADWPSGCIHDAVNVVAMDRWNKYHTDNGTTRCLISR